jgi:protein SCO1/2
MNMRSARYILWGLILVVVATMAYWYQTNDRNSQIRIQAPVVKLGAEFSLTRHDGNPITNEDLLGKPHAIFFGYTNCPDVCPSTLFEMSTWLDQLKDDGDRIGAYFMTVDPARDTAAHLSDYLSSFDARIIGITGERTALEDALRSYKVYFKRFETDDDDYTMDHTASIYLLNAKGEFSGTISYGEEAQSAIEKLRRLVKNSK